MKKQAFFEKLEDLLELDAGTVSSQTLLSELNGWDSMAAIGFIAMADEVAGVAVEPAALAACRSVDDLAALVLADD